ENSILVQLKYAGSNTDTAIVNDLYKFYQVSANILYGNIEILDHTPVGEMVVILSGEHGQLHRAIEAVTEVRVEVTILKGA
ncbi:NIL domain-containing protein, partial [Streptococcus suis]